MADKMHGGIEDFSTQFAVEFYKSRKERIGSGFGESRIADIGFSNRGQAFIS